jgi:hypothetical protein
MFHTTVDKNELGQIYSSSSSLGMNSQMHSHLDLESVCRDLDDDESIEGEDFEIDFFALFVFISTGCGLHS